MSFMQINKFIEADLTYTMKVKKYDDKYEHVRASYSFSEQIYVLQKCTEEGVVVTGSWDAHTSYGACRLDGDVIMYIDPKLGWVRDEVGTEKYAHILAEKELLK